MARLRSLITLVWLVHALAMPLDDDDDDGCGSPPVPVRVPDSPSAAILAPYEHPPTPHPSPSQHPHATVPVSHASHTRDILGAVLGIAIALAAIGFAVRYVIRRRRVADDPFRDPPKPRFTAFRFRPKFAKRLSDESWVSPTLPNVGSPESPLTRDFELRRSSCPQRRLVPVTTPVCTPTDSEFGARLDDPVPVPPVRVPSPVYFSPFSPSPSISSSPSSLSPAPSTEPLAPSSPNLARLSRLLSSTFRDSRVLDSPARPTTAHLLQTARSYAHAYRPSSTTSTSLYTPPTHRPAGTHSRTGFYPGPGDDHTRWERVRDTFSTVTTSDTTCTVPHLLRAATDHQPFASPFADPDPGATNQHLVASPSDVSQSSKQASVGLKLRLSDASEHAHYRLRERERERKRRRERERTSVEAVHHHQRSPSWEVQREFKLRDSESVLREVGW